MKPKIIIVALLFGIIFFLAWWTPRGTRDVVVATVTGRERIVKVVDGQSQSKYIVFTDNEVFENTDNAFIWKFNSSDIQGKMIEGKTFKFTVYGWRWRMDSWYRNIISVEEVEQQPGTRNTEPGTEVQS
jgi:hypothetical protein